jgi:hypothetical protein
VHDLERQRQQVGEDQRRPDQPDNYADPRMGFDDLSQSRLTSEKAGVVCRCRLRRRDLLVFGRSQRLDVQRELLDFRVVAGRDGIQLGLLRGSQLGVVLANRATAEFMGQ